MTAFDILEKMDTEKKEKIRAEYEKYAKTSMKQGFNLTNPEDWLMQHPEIAPKMHGATNYNPNPELTRQFKTLMIEWGFGDLIERARWIYLGR